MLLLYTTTVLLLLRLTKSNFHFLGSIAHNAQNISKTMDEFPGKHVLIVALIKVFSTLACSMYMNSEMC